MRDDSVILVLGGRQLPLCFPNKVLADLQGLLKAPNLGMVLARMDALLPARLNGDGDPARHLLSIDLDDLQKIIWAAIGPEGGHEHFPTPDDVGLAIKVYMLPEIIVVLNAAMTQQVMAPPEAPDNPDPPTEAAAATT